MKKFLSFVLVCIFVLSFVPTAVLAEDVPQNLSEEAAAQGAGMVGAEEEVADVVLLEDGIGIEDAVHEETPLESISGPETKQDIVAVEELEGTAEEPAGQVVSPIAESIAGYDANDIGVINRMIQSNSLTLNESDPGNWKINNIDICQWDNSSPKRIIALHLVDCGLTGDLNLSGLSQLASITIKGNSLTNITLPKNCVNDFTSQEGNTVIFESFTSGKVFVDSYDIAQNKIQLTAYPDSGYVFSNWAWNGRIDTLLLTGSKTTATVAFRMDDVIRVEPFFVEVTSQSDADMAEEDIDAGDVVVDEKMPQAIVPMIPNVRSATAVTVVTGVKLNHNRIIVTAGKTDTRLKAVVSPSNASNKAVIWKSDNIQIAKIDKNTGKITGVKRGVTKVSVTTVDGRFVASCTVVVITPVYKVLLDNEKATVFTGRSMTLKPSVFPSDASIKGVTWKSSNTAVATVTNRGVVKGLRPGLANITATAKDGSGKRATCAVIVRQSIKEITLDTSSRELFTGQACTVKVKSITPATAHNKNVRWKSSNRTIATVSDTGRVQALKPGNVIIAAIAKDGSNRVALCRITVRQSVQSITLNRTVRTVPVGQSYPLKVTAVLPAGAYNKSVSWRSSDSRIATVSDTGVVQGVRSGRVAVVATAKDGSGVKAKCTIYVGKMVSKITLDASGKTLNRINASFTLKSTVYPTDAAYKAVRWSSSNNAVATVNDSGVVVTTGRGTATIVATAMDGSGQKARCAVEVKMTDAEARIYRGTQAVYNQVGTDLYASYKWVTNNFSYVRRSGHISPPAGYTREQWYAVEGLETRRGNCYTYASAFCQLAKGLGYDARYVEGAVFGVRSTWWPHGFVLITIDGSTYICDPELESVSKAGRNLYMQPVSNPRATYRW